MRIEQKIGNKVDENCDNCEKEMLNKVKVKARPLAISGQLMRIEQKIGNKLEENCDNCEKEMLNKLKVKARPLAISGNTDTY